MKLNKIIISISIVLIINTLSGFSQIDDPNYSAKQPKENSPYSRLGMGNLSPQYLTSTTGMGGITAAYRDPYHYNPMNPASLSSLRLTDFDFGLYAKNDNITDGKNSLNGWSGSINHIAIGFPTYSVINEVYDRKPREVRWAMGVALTPYNTMGYLIGTQSAAPSNLDTGVIQNFFIGNGGSYRLMWGNGVSYKGFSAGANVGYLFGKMTNTVQNLLYVNPNAATFANISENSYTLGSFFFNIGLQYTLTLDPKSKYGEKGDKKRLIFGGYTNPSLAMNTTASRIFSRQLIVGNRAVGEPIRLSDVSDIQGSGTLPSETTIGVNYENGSKFRGGIEYGSSSWSQYDNKADLLFSPLKDASQFSVGAEFVLNKSKLKPDEEKIHWRLGYRVGTDPRIFDGEQVKKSALTFGLGLPMRVGRGAQISFMDLGIEYGKIGTDKIVENYWRISLGFTLNDNSWFLKQRYQ